jgi:hypothetical protein
MNTISRFLHECVLVVLAVTMPSAGATAQDDAAVGDRLQRMERVLIQDKSQFLDVASCERYNSGILAGSSYLVGVMYTPREVYEARNSNWPEGYFLDAALDLDSGELFVPTSGLIEELTPTPYWAYVPISWDCPRTLGELDGINFALHIPEDLAGHTLDFRLRYQMSDSLREVQPYHWGMCIIAPRDEYDSARIIASQILEAFDMKSYFRAIELADSMLTHGLTDAFGWGWAIMAAERAHLYDRAVIYLERMWDDFGMLGVNVQALDPRRPYRHATRDQHRQQLFEQRRNELLRLKAEWQQQHR